MWRTAYTAGVICGVFATANGSERADPPGRPMTISWRSDESQQRFSRVASSSDFVRLAPRFQPQANPLYCGIATSTIALNTLRQGVGTAPSEAAFEVAKPDEFGGGTIAYPAYTQATLLDASTESIKPRGVVRLEARNAAGDWDPGLTLAQIEALLRHYGLEADRTSADKADINIFRETARDVLNDDGRLLVCNFVGRELGLTTGGHISPLAAYDAETDSVLVLDVAGHKNGWYWVGVGDLYRAMHTKDGDAYRGWLVVAEGS